MGTVYNKVGGGTASAVMPLTVNAGGTPAGRSLIVFVSRESTVDSVTFSVADNQTNAYVLALNALGGNGTRIIMWVVKVAAAGTTTVTFTASSACRYSAGVIECDLLNSSYYDFAEVQVNEIGTSQTHQCAPDPGLNTTGNDVINLAIGQPDSSGTVGTITYPPGYGLNFSGSLLPTTMGAIRLGSGAGSGEVAPWSHTGAARRCNNVIHSFIFASTTTPSYTIQPQSFQEFVVPRQPAISIGNRVIQVVGGLIGTATMTLTLTQPVGPRSSLVVLVGREGTSDRTFTPSDNGGGSWVQVQNFIGTFITREVQVSVCLNAVPGTTTVTITASGSGNFSGAVIECDRLHATLYDDIRATVDEQFATLSHKCAPGTFNNHGISSPNNVLVVMLGQGGATLGTKTPQAGYTLITGTWASTMFAYGLKPTGMYQDDGAWTGTGTARQAVNLIASLLFDTPTGVGADRLIRPIAIGQDYDSPLFSCEDPTIINELPSGPTTIDLPAIALTLTSQAPVAAFSVDLTFPVITTALTLRSPLVQAGRILATLEVQMVLTLRAPTLVQGTVLQLPVIPLLFDIEPPSLQAVQQVSPPRIPMTLTLRAPTVTASKVISLPSIMGAHQIKFPLIINEQMLTLPAIPLTLQPQASHVVILVEQLLLPAIMLRLDIPSLGKIDTGVEPPQTVGMHPTALSLPMFAFTELGEGPSTARFANMSLHLPMLSGARMM